MPHRTSTGLHNRCKAGRIPPFRRDSDYRRIHTLLHIRHRHPCTIDIDEPLENPPLFKLVLRNRDQQLTATFIRLKRTGGKRRSVPIELPPFTPCTRRCARRKADHNRRTTSLARTSSTGGPILSLSERCERAMCSERHIWETEMISSQGMLCILSHEMS